MYCSELCPALMVAGLCCIPAVMGRKQLDTSTAHWFITGLYCCVLCYIDNKLSDVTLQCKRFVLCLHTPALSSDSVRLATETSLCSGIPSVKSNGSWLSVCGNDLNQQNAEVFCRELQCGPPILDQMALREIPGKDVWTQNIRCQGNESVLHDCQWLTSARKECSPSQSVTLTCLGMSSCSFH